MKIVDRNLYRTIVARKSMRNLKVHLLEFDKGIERQIIKNLLKYTCNFIVVLTDSDERITINRYHKHRCSLDSIAIQLSNIFCGNDHKEYEGKVDEIGEKAFIMFVLDNELMVDDGSYYSLNRKSFHFTYLIESLKHFTLYDYYIYDGHAVVRLAEGIRSDGIQIIEEDLLWEDTKVVLAPLVGIGDYLMMFSLLYEFVLRQKKQDTKVYFTAVDKNISILMLLKACFPNNKCILFDNGAMYNYCLSEDNKDLINLAMLHTRECIEGKYRVQGYHITDTIKNMLGIESVFDIYTHKVYLWKCINNALDKEEKKEIDKFFYQNNYVAFQYFTGSYDAVNNVWATNPDRNWDNDNLNRFVKLCNQSNIRLLVLGGQPNCNINVDRIKTQSIFSYIYILSKTKAFVGIDSSGGHIAAFHNIPSITIWGKQTPKYYQLLDLVIPKNQGVIDKEGVRISFRPLRKNVSIYSKSRCIDRVHAEPVFEQLVDILEEKIEFSETNINYYDNKNCICL